MGAGWIIAWRIATRNIGLVSTLVLVRLLQPADFGLVALATGFINSVDALSAIGVQDALVRVPEKSRNLYDTGFGLSVLRGLLTALLIAAAAYPVAAFFADRRLAMVMLALSAGTVLSALENIGIVDFRRELLFRKEFDLQLWSRIVGASTTLAVAAVWHSYWALVVGILAYRAARLCQSYAMSAYRPRFSVGAWRQLIGFSLWSWGQTIAYQVRERADSVVIGRLLGAGQFGVFSVGAELGSLPTTELVEPLGRALFSGFASLHNASEGMANMFLGAVGMGMMLLLPAAVGISMVADPMVRLSLGEQWISAVPIIQVIAAGGVVAIFGCACGNLLNAVGRPDVSFYLNVATTAAKIAGLLALIPSLGLLGAAVTLVSVGAAETVALLGLTLPRIGVSCYRLAAVVIRPFLATAAMVALLWTLGLAWTPSLGSDVLSIARDAGLRSLLGALAYGVVLILLWAAAGRPDGSEKFALKLAQGAWRRFSRVL